MMAMSDTIADSVDHSTPPAADGLRRTPLAGVHVALGAKMVPFAGYLMPVHYRGGITAEHLAVRRDCGLFDVSHMGEFEVRGPQAVDFAAFVTSNDVRALAVGQVQYSTILNSRGTVEDDCLVYRFADRVMLVVNAANRAKDWAWLRQIQSSGAPVSDVAGGGAGGSTAHLPTSATRRPCWRCRGRRPSVCSSP